MRKQMFPVVRWIVFILIFWTCPVLAQTEASEQAVDTAAGVEAPKAIPTQDLIQKIEETVQETKVIGKRSRSTMTWCVWTPCFLNT